MEKSSFGAKASSPSPLTASSLFFSPFLSSEVVAMLLAGTSALALATRSDTFSTSTRFVCPMHISYSKQKPVFVALPKNCPVLPSSFQTFSNTLKASAPTSWPPCSCGRSYWYEYRKFTDSLPSPSRRTKFPYVPVVSLFNEIPFFKSSDGTPPFV